MTTTHNYSTLHNLQESGGEVIPCLVDGGWPGPALSQTAFTAHDYVLLDSHIMCLSSALPTPALVFEHFKICLFLAV